MIFTVYASTNNIYRVRSGRGGKRWVTLCCPIPRFVGGFHVRYTTLPAKEWRVKSTALPIRETHDEAQRDLDAWAKRKGLRVAATVKVPDDGPERTDICL